MCLIFFQKCFEIPSFCKYILGTSPYEGNLRAERIGNSGTQFFFVSLVETIGAWRAPDFEETLTL